MKKQFIIFWHLKKEMHQNKQHKKIINEKKFNDEKQE